MLWRIAAPVIPALLLTAWAGSTGSEEEKLGRVVIKEEAQAQAPVTAPTLVASMAPKPEATDEEEGSLDAGADDESLREEAEPTDAVVVSVNNDELFLQRIAAARGGEVIPGPTRPTDLFLNNRTFTRPITITGGKFHAVRINNSSGVRFVNSTFARTVTEAQYRLLWIGGSSDISVDNATFDGGGSWTNGINLQNCDDITVSNSRFMRLLNGVRGTDVDRVTVRSNNFTGILADSVGFGSPRFLTVDGNRMDNPNTVHDPHPDGVQVWDIRNIPAHDITVSNNVMDVDAQGIWITSTYQGFDRVSIRGNKANTGRANSISLSGARNSVVEDNEITTRAGSPNMAKLRLERNVGLTVRRVKVCKAVNKDNKFVQYQVTEGWRCPW